jgi:hypothetical protein
LTLDFEGFVLSTKGHAEASAIGFNKAKNGSRRYYLLFCMVAQTVQFFFSICINVQGMSMTQMALRTSCLIVSRTQSQTPPGSDGPF